MLKVLDRMRDDGDTDAALRTIRRFDWQLNTIHSRNKTEPAAQLVADCERLTNGRYRHPLVV